MNGCSTTTSVFRLPPGGLNLDDIEKELVIQALERTNGNQTHAGDLLGINRDQVRYRIEKFGLEKLRSKTSFREKDVQEFAGPRPVAP